MCVVIITKKNTTNQEKKKKLLNEINDKRNETMKTHSIHKAYVARENRSGRKKKTEMDAQKKQTNYIYTHFSLFLISFSLSKIFVTLVDSDY